ncbi:MAG: hypothetical protein GY775_13445 [Candidatus Scalindua sp.]|nr:hypothetical protein [Candidatus Scalindua sp.]
MPTRQRHLLYMVCTSLLILGMAGKAYASPTHTISSIELIPESVTVVLLGICLVGFAGEELRRRLRNKSVAKS